MIEDVKWLKPGDYAARFKSFDCWVAKDGDVFPALSGLSVGEDCVSRHEFFNFDSDGTVKYFSPDGVCERKPNQEKPVLR